MKKKYYIKIWWDFSEDHKPYYFRGNYTNGQWTTETLEAKKFDTKQEAMWAAEGLIKEKIHTEIEIITVYY